MSGLFDNDIEAEVARRIWSGEGLRISELPRCDPEGWAGSVQAQLLAFGPSPNLSARPRLPRPYLAAAAVTMVKDEADILGQNLRRLHLLGVRRFVIVDNNSTDGTRDVIDEFVRSHVLDTEVAIAHDDSVAYLQAEKMTAACRYAISQWCDLDWIIPFDADEFFQAMFGLDALSSVPNYFDAITIPRVIHFRPPDSPDDLGLAGMSVRSSLFSLPPKVVLRAMDRLGLGKGNHKVDTVSGDRVNPSTVLPHDGMLLRLFVSPLACGSFSIPKPSDVRAPDGGNGPSRTSRAIVSRLTFMNRCIVRR